MLLPTADKQIYNLQSKQLIKLFSKLLNVNQSDMVTHLERGNIVLKFRFILKFRFTANAVRLTEVIRDQYCESLCR